MAVETLTRPGLDGPRVGGCSAVLAWTNDRLPPGRSRCPPFGGMLGHDRLDPRDLPGSELTAVEADGLRSGVTALFASVIHPCRVKSPEEKRQR